MKKNTPKTDQRVIHKGMYIANQRRKGPGGRIKSEQFPNKIEVMFPNAALHESQVQWVEIRRYRRGQKRQKNPKRTKQNKFSQVKKENSNKNKPMKFIEKSQDKKDGNKQQKKDTGETDKQTNTSKKQKFVEKKQQVTPFCQVTQKTQTKKDQKSVQKSDQKQSLKQLQENILKDQKQQNNQQQSDGEQTQSESDSDEEILQTDKQAQNKKDQGLSKKQQQPKAKKVQDQVIVAKIVKETKMVFNKKKFVAIMTCEKKKNVKRSHFEKGMNPVEIILKDFFLDISPIHLRLPKMELDTLVKANIKVLANYISKKFPLKEKELTKHILNEILDEIQSIYVVATFGQWGKGKDVYGDIHQIIGKTMTIEGECNCFLHEHQLSNFTYQDSEQSEESKQKSILDKIQPSSKHTRFDKLVFTIDPSTSVDLDDALSIETIEEGVFEIGVHIADVSEYLKFIKRDELTKRTTSVYLPHKVFHMLTQEIMTVSSLNQGVERLAFSIFVRMNEKGELLGQSRIEKNIVKSSYKLSYQTAQEILTGKNNFEQFKVKYPQTSASQYGILANKLKSLSKIALIHRQKRIAFEVFENKQINFELDENKWPIQISVTTRFAAKKVVEQFMIIGNVQAAKHLIKNFKDNSLVIYHPKPTPLSVKNFNQIFKEYLKQDFQFENIRQVQLRFLEIQKDTQIPQEIKQFMYFKGRRVQQAAEYKLHNQAIEDIKSKIDQETKKQHCLNVHFALGEDCYTHFTSPMRRMADIVVHQTLNSLIYGQEPPIVSKDQIQQINNGRKHTKRLKRDLNEMYMCLMIHKTGKIIQQEGIVASFGQSSVSIYIPHFDMMKQIMWKDELQVHKISKDKENPQILNVCIYYDKKDAKKDIIWKLKKFDKVGLTISCTKRPPLRLSISLEVQCKNGKEKIYAINPQIN